ncbi:oligosaccharide flippase family protein [Vaginisenegalia massiliensis]|uniref:oligosaccharide flippase family protein n=1 Tax=Vaginisenegalia massiliensis TaxID=2058294 RepID=UPI000F54BA1E|nr:oligosaccharide flippase family protein [Vaginisenegalia massiliensis]
MINKLKNIISDYSRRGGFHILLSSIISNISGLVLTIIIVRILSQNEYGELMFLQSFVTVFIPFAGLGLNYSLLRFGAIAKTENEKNKIFSLCLKYGFISSLIISAVYCLAVIFGNVKIVTTNYLIVLNALYLITYFLKELSQSYLRIVHKNKQFAYSNIVFSLLVLILGVAGTYFLNQEGFLIARFIAPLIIFMAIIYVVKPHKLQIEYQENLEIREMIKYGVFVGLGSMASSLMMQVDTLALGFMSISASLIAMYKVACQIPLAVQFIPAVILTTDFVMISENYLNGSFLKKYRKRLSLILLVVSLIIGIIILIFGNYIIVMLYGDNYAQASNVLKILTFGVVCDFVLKIPNGNILAAVGKSKWNAILSYVGLIGDIVLNILFIKMWGWYGAAISTALMSVIVGLISFSLCTFYINSINNNKSAT